MSAKFRANLLFVVTIALLVAIVHYASWSERLAFETQLVWQEPWRFVSPMLAHLNGTHAFFNILGLAGVVLIFAKHFTPRTLVNAMIICIVTQTVVLSFTGTVREFVGLSGVIHGLLVTALLLELRSEKNDDIGLFSALKPSDWLLIVPLILTVGKIIFESINVSPEVAQLHGLGFIGGLIAYKLHRQQLARLAKRDTKKKTDV